MDNVSIASSLIGQTQELVQQRVEIAVLKSSIQAQNVMVDALAELAAQQPLRTSGSVGTNINTTA